jgi:type I restriction enzyme R subunit
MKDDLLESEWEKFMEINPVDQTHYDPVKMFFKAYITDEKVREIIASRQTPRFNTESSFSFEEYQRLNGYKTIVPQYVHDYAYQLTNL